MRFYFLTCFVVLLSTVRADEINFNRDIKPILSQNCFQCHGLDDAKREAGLRLDQFDGATMPAESGAIAVVARDPDHSELLTRVTTADPDLHMPPSATNKALTIEQVGLLRQWIVEGANYQGHWAFEKPLRADLPVVDAKHAGRIANPIDNFVAGCRPKRIGPR